MVGGAGAGRGGPGGKAYPGRARPRRRRRAAARAHGRAAARARGPAGIKEPLPVELATSLRPPAGPPRPAACLAGLTASGRSNLARRKVSGLGAAGSVRLNAAMASGRARAASAGSGRRRRRLPMELPLASPGLRATASARPIRASAGSPRPVAAQVPLPRACPPNHRAGWDTPPAPPMSGAPGIGCCLCRPVRRHFRCVENQSALRTPRGPPSATQAQQPRHALSGSHQSAPHLRLLQTAAWQQPAAGRALLPGANNPGSDPLASSSPLGPGRCGLPGPAVRARPQTRGPAPGHQGTSLDRSAPRHAGRCSSRPAGDSPPQTYACRPPPGPFLSNPASA